MRNNESIHRGLTIMLLYRITLENYIDGPSLLSLVADLDEFQHLVPQSAFRMKIKKIVQELRVSHQ